MTMKILNEELTPDKLTPVIFVFPPVEIPVTFDGIISEEVDDQFRHGHYASVVYDINDDRFIVLEYSLKIFHALASYNQRHGNIGDLEVLLTRHPDGKFKMTIGNTDKPPREFSQEEKEKAAEIQNNLVDYYKGQENYKVNDL